MVTKDQIDRLNAEVKPLQERVKKIGQAIRALQELCDHDFESIGRDSHHDHCRCKVCGVQDKDVC